MDNFKLTTKEEVLNFLENKACSLKRQAVFAKMKASFFCGMAGVSLLSFQN